MAEQLRGHLLGLGELAGSFLIGQLQVRQLPVNFLQQAAVGFQDIVFLLELILLLEELLLARFLAADKVFTCARDPLGNGLGLPLALAEAFQLFDVAVVLLVVAIGPQELQKEILVSLKLYNTRLQVLDLRNDRFVGVAA